MFLLHNLKDLSTLLSTGPLASMVLGSSAGVRSMTPTELLCTRDGNNFISFHVKQH